MSVGGSQDTATSLQSAVSRSKKAAKNAFSSPPPRPANGSKDATKSTRTIPFTDLNNLSSPQSMKGSSPGGRIRKYRIAEDKAASRKATKESATNLAKEVTAAKKKATIDLKRYGN